MNVTRLPSKIPAKMEAGDLAPLDRCIFRRTRDASPFAPDHTAAMTMAPAISPRGSPSTKLDSMKSVTRRLTSSQNTGVAAAAIGAQCGSQTII